jgi:hypothetical protein
MGQNMIRFGNAVELPARQLPFVAQAIDDVTRNRGLTLMRCASALTA